MDEPVDWRDEGDMRVAGGLRSANSLASGGAEDAAMESVLDFREGPALAAGVLTTAEMLRWIASRETRLGVTCGREPWNASRDNQSLLGCLLTWGPSSDSVTASIRS